MIVKHEDGTDITVAHVATLEGFDGVVQRYAVTYNGMIRGHTLGPFPGDRYETKPWRGTMFDTYGPDGIAEAAQGLARMHLTGWI